MSASFGEEPDPALDPQSEDDRNARLALLAIASGFAFLCDVWAFTASPGGDGLGGFWPGVCALLGAPFQITLAIVAFIRRADRREREWATPPPMPAPGATTLAAAMLATPAVAMLVALVLVALARDSGLGSRLAEEGIVLWAPCWAFGASLAGYGFGRSAPAWPLWLAPLYPAAGALYAMT